MRIALDPYMFRHVPLLELPSLVAELGYEWMELSPRDDVTPFFLHPRIDDATVAAFRKELSAAGVGISSVLPLFAREGIKLALEPHPDDFIEDGRAAVDLIRGVNSPLVSFLYCAPHNFHQGNDAPGILRHAGPLTTAVHLADTFDHTGSSGLRYIVNPPGSAARIHQHLDIGQGEVDFDELFRELAATGFDGTLVSSVFAWEERAAESSRFMRAAIDRYVKANWS
ncbi:sugar phosphate isomerase/epimerase family protein [Streptomyces pinistramenti]|uniref:sugar phosphate isomerase/epimerase family protein n=1 Tax=Streptomyces pinistramenti TaxID=2884812 RepID=UPI001D06C3EC|nr:sugar phosphate isomerase/epimerase [Streptomyces pinistramenti]MCB5908017.1 sugar phosphate isomerase/epimerase [Streptomyces pinistramenti]